jgi:hypothetical protein
LPKPTPRPTRRSKNNPNNPNQTPLRY